MASVSSLLNGSLPVSYTHLDVYKRQSPMDLFTDCSPEIKKLFDILHTVDFSKKNRKVYISGKITKTEDYQERFDVAARELLAQGYEVVNPEYVGTKLENASYEDYMMSLIHIYICIRDRLNS